MYHPSPRVLTLPPDFHLRSGSLLGQTGPGSQSPNDATAVACLPMLCVDGYTGPRWNSKTNLLVGLAEHCGTKEKEEMEGNGGVETL